MYFVLVVITFFAGLLFYLCSVCDHSCWEDWFNGYYPGSGEYWREKESIVNNSYCENKGIDFSITPTPFLITYYNTWSNFAFVALGTLSIGIALHDYILQKEIWQEKYTSQVRKHPEWIMLHGVILIYGGIGSYAFHASFTDLAHKLDMTGVISMLSFAFSLSVLNLFLEELNGIYAGLGDMVSRALAPLMFLGNIFFGFWVLAKRYKFSSTKLIVYMAFGYIIALLLKLVIKRLTKKYFKINWKECIIAIVSILIAVCCQEEIFMPAPWCHPTSWF